MKNMKHVHCTVNRKVESITGSVFVFVSREAAILAQNVLQKLFGGSARTRWGAHSAASDLGEGKDGRGKWQGKGSARGYVKGGLGEGRM